MWAYFAIAASEQEAETEKAGLEFLKEARKAADEGLRIALDCGYGIYHIDLQVAQAQVALREGKPEEAIDDLEIALSEGVHPKKESGLPTLLAATDEECGYAWGQGDCRHHLAEAYLLQAAQLLGDDSFVPAKRKELPEDVKALIADAEKELKQCIKLRKKIQDPKAAASKKIVSELKKGMLTIYPLTPLIIEGEPEPDTAPVPVVASTDGRQHVFISYCVENRDFVVRLAAALEDAGEKVWWDKRVGDGQDFDTVIMPAIRNSYAFILCASSDLMNRKETNVWPEVNEAIKQQRKLPPDNVFILPVRLSACKLPETPITANNSLSSLRRIDLYPEPAWNSAISRLVNAIRTAPLRP